MGFHENFGDIVRRRLKADRRHASGHRSRRTPLRNSGLHSEFPVPVWPLGGAKRISLILDISLVSEPIGAIFSPDGRSRRGPEIPPSHSGIPLPVLGSAPQNEIFFHRLVPRNWKFLTSQFLHMGRA